MNKRKTSWSTTALASAQSREQRPRGGSVEGPLGESSFPGPADGWCPEPEAAPPGPGAPAAAAQRARPAGRARRGQVEDAGGAGRRKGRPGACPRDCPARRLQPAARSPPATAAASASPAAAPGVPRTRRCPPAPPSPPPSATEPEPEPPPQPQPRTLW